MIKVLNKNIIIVDKNDLPRDMSDRGDAFSWLTECYPHMKGKRVGVDDFLFGYLVNNPFTSSRDYVESVDGFERFYRLQWNESPEYNDKKNEGYPEMQIILGSYGKAREIQNTLGRVLVENNEENLHFIQEIFAEKPIGGMKMEYQMPKLGKLDTLFLVASPNKNLLKRIESFLKN